MTWNDHDHRGEYAEARHDHDLDYAEKHHRHYDDESTARGLREDLSHAEERIRELEDGLRGALERIGDLEKQTPQARQLQLEADLAAADLAESGYGRHGRDCRCPFCYYDPEEDETEPTTDPLGTQAEITAGCAETSDGEHTGDWHEGGRCGACGLYGPIGTLSGPRSPSQSRTTRARRSTTRAE